MKRPAAWALASTVLALILGGAPAEAAAPPLRLVSSQWAPYTGPVGRPRVAIDLVHAALTKAGYAPTIEIRPPGTLTEALRTQAFHGIAAVWRDEERARFLLFSKPYLVNRLVLVGRKGTDVSATEVEALKGKRLGVVAGYAYGPQLEAKEGPVLVPAPDHHANLQALLAEEIDYLLADQLVVHRAFERRKEQAERLIEVGRRPLLERNLHFAVRKDLPDAERIVKSFDAVIDAMLADGSFNRILHVDWIIVDMDGDGRGELVANAGIVGPTEPTTGYSVREPAREVESSLEREYVIGGKTYPNWESIPDEFKRPFERKLKAEKTGVTLFRF